MKSFFEGLEVWKYSDRRRYDNMKAVARINGALLVFGTPVFMLLALGSWKKGDSLLGILVGEIFYGMMWLFALRWWQW